jgi:hypothetical protein
MNSRRLMQPPDLRTRYRTYKNVWAGRAHQSPLWVTCGRRLGKNFLTLRSIGRVRSRVRPVDAADVPLAAGPNALRGSGPNR